MKIAIYPTEKIFQKWPDSYWGELTDKLLKLKHRVFILSDDNPHEKNDEILSDCDLYIGAPGQYYDLAKEKGIQVIGLLGATKKGEGVVSTTACAGCLDIMENVVDCNWQDDLCMLEITPNDVLEAVCG
jgi:ADP-heptose:LPS heptosyltransferase